MVWMGIYTTQVVSERLELVQKDIYCQPLLFRKKDATTGGGAGYGEL